MSCVHANIDSFVRQWAATEGLLRLSYLHMLRGAFEHDFTNQQRTCSRSTAAEAYGPAPGRIVTLLLFHRTATLLHGGTKWDEKWNDHLLYTRN